MGHRRSQDSTLQPRIGKFRPQQGLEGSNPRRALAARVVFAISPNSASCERVFSLLKNLFGEQQMAALADYVQASLMLNYNGRNVG